MTDKHKIQNEQHYIREKNNHLPDDKNPIFLFSTTDTELLVQIAKGIIKPKKLAIKELKKRGLNRESRWAGFEIDR